MGNDTHPDTKLGLALSGGGFRSALFHVGVLARLAECNLLDKIDVISSVSGGSIIAAYYYLKVRNLIEQARVGQFRLDRDAYVRMVAEIEIDFLKSVQKNMRIRTFMDPIKNARMMAVGYSNTERLAELLTTHFYLPVLQKSNSLGENKRIPLKNIALRSGAGKQLPDQKLPFLIINATSLNTGHLWQFTSDSIGEKPTYYETGESSIPFFKRFRFDDERLTIEHRKILYNITLGQAVAASCCVPGILEPLQIPNLYKSGRKFQTIRLVDGGLVDNQGLASLFTENCTHIICSDASDILKFESDPSVQFLNVAIRANDILLDRSRSKALNKMFEYGSGRYALFDLGDSETKANIFPSDSENMVNALTRIRTDMDAFTDREAFSLMYYGYRLSGIELEKKGFDLLLQPPPVSHAWRFLEIEDCFFKNEADRNDLLFHLEVGSRQMFKLFMFKKPLPYMIVMPIPALIVILVLYLMVKSSPVVLWWILIGTILILVYTQNHRLLKLMDNITFLRSIRHRMIKILVSTRLPEPFSYLTAMVAWFQLHVFDRLFLKYGRICSSSDKSKNRSKHM